MVTFGSGTSITWLFTTSRGLLEPPGAQLVEHLALEGNGAQDAVEGRYTVGGDQDPLPFSHVDIPHLAFQARPEFGQVHAPEGVGNSG